MENNFDDIFQDMRKKSLISTSNSWLDRAIQQKNSKLTVALAQSKLLIYDKIDREIVRITSSN